MRIELLSQELYDNLLKVQQDFPVLTYQNKGYDGIDMYKLTDIEVAAFRYVEDVLAAHVYGFSSFQNFKLSNDGELVIRIQYDYCDDPNHTGNLGSFIGVGYAKLIELLNGFGAGGYFGFTLEQMKDIQSLISMIDSCYAYDSYEKDTRSYEQYIVPRGEPLGKELFDRVYEARIKELKENFTITRGVYTDGEGCTYNSLVRKAS